MAAYDIGNVKREPLEDFHTDTTYLDHLMVSNITLLPLWITWLPLAVKFLLIPCYNFLLIPFYNFLLSRFSFLHAFAYSIYTRIYTYSYVHLLQPYSNDVFDAPVDWLSNFVDDRSALHSISEQLGGQPTDYSHLNLNCVDRDQTLNRLNGASLNHRGAPYAEEFSTPFPAAAYSASPPSPDFDHRLEVGAHDLDYEMKSFYAGQQLYAASQVGESAAVFGEDIDKMGLQKNSLAMAVPGVCEEDEMAHSSGDSDQDRDDSESGMVILYPF